MTNLLGYITWHFDPVIVRIKLFGLDFPLMWYGFLFMFAFLIGQIVMGHILRVEGKPKGDLDQITMYMLAGTIIGARLGHYLFYEWEFLVADPLEWFIRMVTPPFAGLASHGATIGIILAIYLYSRKKPDQPFLWIIDRIVIVVSFAGFIRIGNLFNSEIYGIPTDLPWGFRFIDERDPVLLPVVPRHPTQIYEFLFCVLLFIITYWMWKYKRHVLADGIMFCTFTILLFTFRFFVEFLKNDQSSFEANMSLNMGQILSIPLVLGTAMLMFYLHKKGKKTPSEIPDAEVSSKSASPG